MPSKLIYLDNNATSRVYDEVVAAMAPYWSDIFFNPSSEAGELLGAQDAVSSAKRELATHLGGSPEEFIFTSGATEANNWVLKSVCSDFLLQRGGCTVVVSAVEHPSIRSTAMALAESDQRIKCIEAPVTSDGVVDLAKLEKLITPETCIVSVMMANNESGVIQPLAEIAKHVKALNSNCLIHTDATQAVGRIVIDLDDDLRSVDLLSLSVHKSHGPKGIGALFIRNGIKLTPLIHGGGQQVGLRSGTENPALAMGLAKAIALTADRRKLQGTSAKVMSTKELFETRLQSVVDGIGILGKTVARLPNTSLLLLPGLNGGDVVSSLLQEGIIVSTGSACDRGSDAPSHVLLAMGMDYNDAFDAIRVSMSSETEVVEVFALISALQKLVTSHSLRSI